MSPRVLLLGTDGPPRLRALAEDVATVEGPEALPIGARVELRAGVSGPAATAKVTEVARAAEGFRVRLRLFSPTRAVRAALAAAVVAPPEPPRAP